MKKLWIAFAIAMAALMIFAGPALAWGDVWVDVDCSDIEVTDDSPTVGTTITFSGTVDITSIGYNNTDYCYFPGGGTYTGAQSYAYHVIYDPDGVVIAYGDNPILVYDEGYWCWEDACANASQVYTWSEEIYIDMLGDYYAEHGGDAAAAYGHFTWVWVGGWGGHWEKSYYCWDDIDYDSCSSNLTVTAYGGATAPGYRSPYLFLDLPDGSRHFFPSDGWGDPTSQDIVYTDGIWQVEIQGGTVIQMDGEWHRITYLEVDSQGNVTGRYNAGGSTVATDIGLSQPMTITKVG